MRRFAQNHQYYILVAFLLVMSSCVKEMDFGGVKDITLTPQMQIELLKAEITQDKMVEIFENETGSTHGYIPGNGVSVSLPNPIVKPISLTSEERILKYLVDGVDEESGVVTPVLNFEFTNTINCKFDFEISLLDKDGVTIEKSGSNGNGSVNASTNGEIEESHVSYSYKVADIKRATDISIEVKLTPEEDLYPEIDRELTFEGNGIFNFSYDSSEGLP